MANMSSQGDSGVQGIDLGLFNVAISSAYASLFAFINTRSLFMLSVIQGKGILTLADDLDRDMITNLINGGVNREWRSEPPINSGLNS